MITTQKSVFTKDIAKKQMNVVREFAAPLKEVWAAWTERELLDQWWAPKPWKAETKTMEFKEGGRWVYCMAGPNGEKHWAKSDYKKIVALNYFTASDSFCDENGNTNSALPQMDWKLEFSESEVGTKVQVEITFKSEKDMQGIIDTGFEEGFSAAHGNLDELLAN